MVRGFKARANRIAIDVRKELGLPAIAPLDPHAVCRHYEIRVIPLSTFGDAAKHFLETDTSEFSALTVPRGMQRAIVHNDAHAKPRQKSNIMHELAHSFLGHAPRQTFDCKGDREYDGGIEEEAAFLSGSLLITNEAAWHIVKSGIVAQAGRQYGVSQKMLQYRLRISGAMMRARRSSWAA